jgi:hypothetical protein
MQAKHSLAVVALVALASFVAAQQRAPLDGKQPKQPPHPTDPLPPSFTTSAVDLGQPTTLPATPIRCGVTGLTRENAAQVQLRLASITTPAFSCPQCSIELPQPTTCPADKATLAPTRRPLLESATTLPEEGVIIFVPSFPTRLSTLARELALDQVQLDQGQLPLRSYNVLEVRDVPADKVGNLENDIREAKVFAQVRAVFDPSTRLTRVTVRDSATPATYDQFAQFLAQRGAGLADVIFGNP